MHSVLCLAQQLINDFISVRTMKNMLLGLNDKNNKKKQRNIKKINKRNNKMKILKNLKLFVLSSILLAVVLTGLSLNAKKDIDVNQPAVLEIPESENFVGTSEFIYKSKDDNRTWHVINRYSSGLTDDLTAYNNSEYTFTKESVTVINNYAGINSREFKANK